MGRGNGFTRGRIAAILLVGLMLVGVSYAGATPPTQEGMPIVYGETLSGEITEAVPCQYFWFQGSAGDPITIDMTRTSGSLDGVLDLYLRDGINFSAQPIANSDDRSGGGLDPLITFHLPETNWYTIAACRLQAAQMRVTTGTFDLTLTGPAVSDAGVLPDAATPTPLSGLTGGLFPVESPTPAPNFTPTPVTGLTGGILPPAENSVTPTPTEAATQDAGAETIFPQLENGSLTEGELLGDQQATHYQIVVRAGDEVSILWSRTGGDFAPLLRAEDFYGRLVASAETTDPVSTLTLTFSAPTDDLLILRIGRAALPNDSAGTFQLEVAIVSPVILSPTPAAGVPAAATPAGDVPATTDYLAIPCQSAASAVSGRISSERLIDVYTAAGDSYEPDQLVETTSFRTTDDLNVVFGVRPDLDLVHVAGIFCTPGGEWYDAGESEADSSMPHLLGLDWETSGIDWERGGWYVEIYVDDTLELTLGFAVE